MVGGATLRTVTTQGHYMPLEGGKGEGGEGGREGGGEGGREG